MLLRPQSSLHHQRGVHIYRPTSQIAPALHDPTIRYWYSHSKLHRYAISVHHPIIYTLLPSLFLYKCIGARLKILLHLCFLNSAPTIPFNRLPIGSPPLLISTQALSSKLTTLPSARWYFFFVRTTTACLMSPLRTLLAAETETEPPDPDSGPKLRCFWTTTMMRSPGRGRS